MVYNKTAFGESHLYLEPWILLKQLTSQLSTFNERSKSPVVKFPLCSWNDVPELFGAGTRRPYSTQGFRSFSP